MAPTIGQELKGKPQWVKWMRNDQKYFKTCERYQTYWEHHFRPTEHEEGEHEDQTEDPRRWIVKIFQSEEQARSKADDLLLDYKYFKKWRFEMEPYVQSDGSIMNKDERLNAWKQANSLK